ncbi:hypothetical protein D3C72_2392970 [compost metagenome]
MAVHECRIVEPKLRRLAQEIGFRDLAHMFYLGQRALVLYRRQSQGPRWAG